MNSTELKELDSQAEKIIAQYDEKRASVLTLLHLAQDKIGYVTPEAETWVSKWTEVPIVHIREVVTFYSMFHQKPVGKNHIRFCTGTSCMLMGGEKVLYHLKKKFRIKNGQVTVDGRISLEEAECLCACEIAPMMQVNDKYVGNLTEKKIDDIIEELRNA